MKEFKEPSEESLRKVMELAWNDHHHARNQTWKTVQMVAVLGAGLLTVDLKYQNFWATGGAAILVIIAAIFGILITWHHRKLEIRKFIHIMNCEEKLGLHRYDIIPLHPKEIRKFVDVNEMDIPTLFELQTGMGKNDDLLLKVRDSRVAVPKMFTINGLIRFWSKENQNTSLFIMGIHCAILFFALIIFIFRFISYFFE